MSCDQCGLWEALPQGTAVVGKPLRQLSDVLVASYRIPVQRGLVDRSNTPLTLLFHQAVSTLGLVQLNPRKHPQPMSRFLSGDGIVNSIERDQLPLKDLHRVPCVSVQYIVECLGPWYLLRKPRRNLSETRSRPSEKVI